MEALHESSLPALSVVPALKGFEPKIALEEASQPYATDCQIEAKHDLQAVSCWLRKYAAQPKTWEAYRRESQRLLMWCVYERGLSLGQLKAQDFEAYFQFLQAPPASWCTTRSHLRAGRHSRLWRPLIAGLKPSALKMALRVIHSLMNYLVSANYVRSNPLKLVHSTQGQAMDLEERKYQVWERMLENDEWQALQKALQELPQRTVLEIDHKLSTQLLVGLLYFLGLRIHEVANHTWNAFRLKDEQWWFFVKGKGQKYAHIPVNHELLAWVKMYRLHLGKVPLPSPDEAEPFFMSRVRGKALKIRQLYNWIKALGKEASKQFRHAPLKEEKLQRLSPHWLRHLFASHQDKAGVPATIIKANMRHASHQSTQVYLHAEDNLRHQAVQKIKMEAGTLVTVQEKPSPDIRLKIALSGHAVNRLLSLEKCMQAIEQNVLAGYRWQWEGLDKAEFFEKVKRAGVLLRTIVFNYRLEPVPEAIISQFKAQIKLEAEIRLLKAEIEFNL
jgi:site-specific recombinase XerD